MKVPVIIKSPEEILNNIKSGIFDVLDNEESMERDDINVDV